MKKLLLVVLALTLPVAALAQETHCYGWENGETVLGTYLPDYMYLANTDAYAYEGTRSLEIYETGGTSTPQAYVAWITDLVEGDVVTATFQTWDPTAGSNPSLRIWGHWTNVGGDINSYNSSASGGSTYSGGEGWIELGFTWTVDALHAGMGLVVEARPYNGTPWVGSVWMDHVCVTRPATATLHFPGYTVVGDRDSSWGQVKGLYR
ncbi:MAG: hypothetical protein R6X35_12065 [Candidatus Krumholzibacteriia bacterium]